MARIGPVAKILKFQEKREDANKPLVAVGYARFSDAKKVDMYFTSAEAQEAIIREYVNANPRITLETVFSDPGRSGKDTNRPAYKRMCERIEQGGVDLVIAYKLDRLGRNDDDLHALYKFLSDHNVSLLYTNGPNFEQTPDGEYMKRITVANAVLERELASRRVADKYLESLKRGVMCGAMRPIGYVSGDKPGSALIDEDAAAVVKRIFELCIAGHRPSEIAKMVNMQYGGRPLKKLKNGKTKSGGLFTETQIKMILLNPFYAGYVYINVGKYGTTDAEFKLYDGVHEAIISREDWRKAVELVKSNRREGRYYPEIKNESRFLLKKYLRCSCGSCMTVASSGKKSPTGETYRYYACTQKKHLRDACRCETHIPLNIIEPLIFASLGYFLSDKIRKTPISEDREYLAEVDSSLNKLKRSAQKLKAELNAQLDILTHFEGSVAVRTNIEERIKKLGDEIESNTNEQNKLKRERSILNVSDNISTARINSTLGDLYNLQANISDSEKREILLLAVEKIVLKCENRLSKYKKEMSIRIFAKEEFANKIPPSEIKFTVDTHSGISEWEVLTPFRLSSSLRKVQAYQPQKRHWIHEVVKWQKSLMDSGQSMREFCKTESIPFSMFQRKLRLLETLSSEVLEYLLALSAKEETEKLSFRMLYELSQLPKDVQIKRLKGRLRVL